MPCLVQRLGGYESAGTTEWARRRPARSAGSRASQRRRSNGHTLAAEIGSPGRTRAFETRASAHFPSVRRDFPSVRRDFPSVTMTSHPLRCYKSPQKRQNSDPMNGKSSQSMGSRRQWMVRWWPARANLGPGPTWTRAARRIRAPGPDRARHQAQTEPDTKRGPNRTPGPHRTSHRARTEPDTGRGPNQTPGADRKKGRTEPDTKRGPNQGRKPPDIGRGPTDPGASRRGKVAATRARTGLGAKAAKLALAWRFGHVVRLLLKRLLK